MSRSVVLAALLAAGLALLPGLYLTFTWPSVLAFVPTHYDLAGNPDHFVRRIWLRDISWLPGLAWVVLTLLPQVQEGQSLFWSSQRRTRLVVVGSLVLFILSMVYRGSHHSRPTLMGWPTVLAPAP